MFIPSITYTDLKEFDVLFYRPGSIFGKLIGLYTAIKNKKFDRLAFSHSAIFIEGKRFDAMEGYRTGFRDSIGKAYVFRFKNITDEQKHKIKSYLLSRQGSSYDRKGIFSFLFPEVVREDEFSDYCCELLKNAFVFAEVIQDTERLTPYELYVYIREKVDFIGLIV